MTDRLPLKPGEAASKKAAAVLARTEWQQCDARMRAIIFGNVQLCPPELRPMARLLL